MSRKSCQLSIVTIEHCSGPSRPRSSWTPITRSYTVSLQHLHSLIADLENAYGREANDLYNLVANISATLSEQELLDLVNSIARRSKPMIEVFDGGATGIVPSKAMTRRQLEREVAIADGLALSGFETRLDVSKFLGKRIFGL